MINSTIRDFCCANNTQMVKQLLNTFDDIDVLYKNGTFFDFAITKGNVEICKSLIEYFETKQFPVKDQGYEEAKEKLITILESAIDGVEVSHEMQKVLQPYINNSESDIALDKDNHIVILDFQDKSTHYTHHKSNSAERDKLATSIKIDEEDQTKEETNILSDKNRLASVSNKYKAIELRKQADAYLKSQDFETAESFYKMAIKAYPKYPTAFLHWGDCLTLKAFFGEAKEKYEEAIKLDNNYSYAYKKLGDLYYKYMGNFQEGIKYYVQAINHKPSNVQYTDLYSKIVKYITNNPGFVGNYLSTGIFLGDEVVDIKLKELLSNKKTSLVSHSIIESVDDFNQLDSSSHNPQLANTKDAEVSGDIIDHHDIF